MKSRGDKLEFYTYYTVVIDDSTIAVPYSITIVEDDIDIINDVISDIYKDMIELEDWLKSVLRRDYRIKDVMSAIDSYREHVKKNAKEDNKNRDLAIEFTSTIKDS